MIKAESEVVGFFAVNCELIGVGPGANVIELFIERINLGYVRALKARDNERTVIGIFYDVIRAIFCFAIISEN